MSDGRLRLSLLASIPTSLSSIWLMVSKETAELRLHSVSALDMPEAALLVQLRNFISTLKNTK
jgi:hypothetical protein